MGDAPQINPCQVLRKVEGVAEAERAAAVETVKPKEAVARARCWKGSLLKGLKRTGELLIRFSWECAATVQTQMLLFMPMGICCKPKCYFSSSELFVLPSITFLAVGFYAGMAIIYYKQYL